MFSKFFLLLLIITILDPLRGQELEDALASLPETLNDLELMKSLAILFVARKLNTPNASKESKISEYIRSINQLEAIRYQKKRNLSDRYNELNTSMGDLDEIVDTLESSITSRASSLRIAATGLDSSPGNVPKKDRDFYLQKISDGFNNKGGEEPESDRIRVRKIRKIRRKKKRKLMKKGVNKEKEKLINEIKKLQNELKKKKRNIILGRRKF